MLPLFDMLNQAQGGQAMDLLARQFKLSTEQAQLATEALLPAFSQGLKRNAADPYGFAAIMQSLARSGEMPSFPNMAQAFSPSGVSTGNDILSQLFGSKELSRAIAAQAEQATGIGREIFKQMLPVLATMIMGSIAKQATAPQGSANPLSAWMDAWAKHVQSGAASRTDATQNPFAATPWGQMMEGMMRGMQPEQREPPKPENPSGRPRNPYDDLFSALFETGHETQADYQRKTEAIFDQFIDGMTNRPKK